MRKSRARRIGAVIAAIAFGLTLTGLALAAKMDCKQACDLLKKTCVESCTGGLRKVDLEVNPKAVGKCKEACENARKKCEEICKAQKDRGGFDDEDDDEGGGDEE